MDTKILASFMVIGLVMAAMGMGTYALFSDTETSTGNTFTAGTLDLKVDGKDDPHIPVYFTVEAKPSEWKEVEIDLTNAGTNDGIADLHVTITDEGGGMMVEPECVAEGGTWTYDETTGEWYCNNNVVKDDICSYLDFDWCYDLDNDETCDEDEYNVEKVKEIDSSTIDLGQLPEGETRKLWLSLHLQDVGNEYQGDFCKFDIEFTLKQT